jgi:spermidine synthase
LTDLAEAMSHAPAKVVFSRSTSYQKMTVTHHGDEWRLYLNGNLQFSSRDEYRYHEALVHVGLASLKSPRQVLVLGGGDGMAVREILKYPSVTNVTLVDLDPAMTRLFSSSSFAMLNDGALKDSRVKIVNDDAYRWLNQSAAQFDFIVIDFPDPSSFSVGKLFSTHFFERLKKVMSDESLAVIQSSSPLFAREAYWCVVHTIQASSLWAAPYHSYVPSFGEWGFVLFAKETRQLEWRLPPSLRFITPAITAQMFEFPSDMSEVPTDINRLNNQALVRYFDANWSEYVH